MITSGLTLQNHEVLSVTSQVSEPFKILSLSLEEYLPHGSSYKNRNFENLACLLLFQKPGHICGLLQKVACNSVNISQSDSSMKFQIFTSRGIKPIGKGQPSFS